MDMNNGDSSPIPKAYLVLLNLKKVKGGGFMRKMRLGVDEKKRRYEMRET